MTGKIWSANEVALANFKRVGSRNELYFLDFVFSCTHQSTVLLIISVTWWIMRRVKFCHVTIPNGRNQIMAKNGQIFVPDFVTIENNRPGRKRPPRNWPDFWPQVSPFNPERKTSLRKCPTEITVITDSYLNKQSDSYLVLPVENWKRWF